MHTWDTIMKPDFDPRWTKLGISQEDHWGVWLIHAWTGSRTIHFEITGWLHQTYFGNQWVYGSIIRDGVCKHRCSVGLNATGVQAFRLK